MCPSTERMNGNGMRGLGEGDVEPTYLGTYVHNYLCKYVTYLAMILTYLSYLDMCMYSGRNKAGRRSDR